MAFEAYTHAIHGQFSLPPQDALLRQSLIAVSGRLIAVGAGNHIHLYDSHEVSNVTAVLGPGSCKFRFLCSFPIMDISDSVTVTSLLFLRGGHLALSGLCAKGTGKFTIMYYRETSNGPWNRPNYRLIFFNNELSLFFIVT